MKTIAPDDTTLMVAAVLHLYYPDLWPEFMKRLWNLQQAVGQSKLDVFISLTAVNTTQLLRSEILRVFPNATIQVVPDKGMDIGPFLLWMQQLYERGLEERYGAVVKLHTKKSLRSIGAACGQRLRTCLADAIAGSPELVNRCLDLLKNPEIGMVGAHEAVSTYRGSNQALIDVLRAWLGIPAGSGRFMSGTMFWIKMPILRRYLTPQVLGALYQCMPEQYATDGTAAHGMERVFADMVEGCGYELATVESSPLQEACRISSAESARQTTRRWRPRFRSV